MSVESVNFTRWAFSWFIRMMRNRIRSAMMAASLIADTNVEYAQRRLFLKSDHTDFFVDLVEVCWYSAKVRASIHTIFLGRPVLGVLGSTCLQLSEICVTIVLRFVNIDGVIFAQRLPNGSLCVWYQSILMGVSGFTVN